MLAIFLISSLSSPRVGGETPDYILHALEYFLLALLLIRLFLSRQDITITFSRWQTICLLGFFAAVAYGVTDEIHQYFTPGRHCSLRDIFSDTVGAFLAYGIALSDYLFITRCRYLGNIVKQSPIARTLSYAACWWT